MEYALLKLISEDQNWSWKAEWHIYMYFFLNFLIFFLSYFSYWKFWKVDFVGENKKQKNKTLQNKTKTNLPKPSTQVSFSFLIIAVGVLFGQHFHDPTCNMIVTDDRWCLFMNTKHSAKSMIFPCEVGYADKKRILKVRHLEIKFWNSQNAKKCPAC